MRRWLRGVALLAVLTGCNDEPTARFELDKQGLSQISLTPGTARGEFAFKAKKTDSKDACSGTVKVSRGFGRTSTSMTSTCVPDEDACSKSDAAFCFDLGERLRADDRSKANRFYDTACEAGHGAACNTLGFSYENGLGIAKDPKAARARYDRACEAGNAMGCRNAGILRKSGDSGEPDPKGAFERFEKACAKDDAPGCYEVGVAHANAAGTEKSFKLAAAAFEKACAAKVEEACPLLGIVLVEGGDGLEKNQARGVSLLIDGCKRDDAQACANLAVLSSRKLVDDASGERRASWAEKACTGKQASGCVELALLFEHGHGGKKRDLKEALAYQIKACDLDSAVGCNNVGVMMEKGLGIARNPERAAEAYARACKLGFTTACK